jgi:hypothetical protein
MARMAAEKSIPDVTLNSWLRQCRQQGMPVLGYRNAGDDGTPEAKLVVEIETASLSEVELGTYCRQKGLYL